MVHVKTVDGLDAGWMGQFPGAGFKTVCHLVTGVETFEIWQGLQQRQCGVG